MKFLVDDQLPTMLAGIIAEFGVTARHVVEVKLGAADDALIWRFACAEDWIVVSKDADFIHFQGAVTPPRGRVLWLRFGNVRRPQLAAAIREHMPACIVRFRDGETLVEIR